MKYEKSSYIARIDRKFHAVYKPNNQMYMKQDWNKIVIIA